MKLHLPKLLRVALLCVVCGVSAATAADLSPDIKDVAPNGVSYQYYDIGNLSVCKKNQQLIKREDCVFKRE